MALLRAVAVAAGVASVGLVVWSILAPPEPALPIYAVVYRDVGSRSEGHVLVRSLTPETAGRERICESIAAAERLDVALFFSTEAAHRAYRERALLRYDQETPRAALKSGFVGQVAGGVFTTPDVFTW